MSNAYKTILTFEAALGGVVFRATSNGVDVNLQSRKVGNSTWKTEARVTRFAFDVATADLRRDALYGGRSPAHGFSDSSAKAVVTP